MTIQRITRFVRYVTQAEDADKFYVSVFSDSRITHVSRYRDAGPARKAA